MKRVVCEKPSSIDVDQELKRIICRLYPREVEELHAEIVGTAQNRRNEEFGEDLRLLSRQIRAMQDGIAEIANSTKNDVPTPKTSTNKNP